MNHFEAHSRESIRNGDKNLSMQKEPALPAKMLTLPDIYILNGSDNSLRKSLLNTTGRASERPQIWLYPRKSIISVVNPVHSIQHDGELRATLANRTLDVQNAPDGYNSNSESKSSITLEKQLSKISDRHTSVHLDGERKSATRRPVSILSVKQIQTIRKSAHEEQADESVLPLDEMSMRERSKLEYLNYLKASQRHDSTNFIHILDSAEGIDYNKPTIALKVIGTFLLGDKIGKGAFGKVKEAICTETLQRVAVKILSKNRVKKAQNGIEGVIREIKLLRKLNHENIVNLLNVYAKVEDKDGNTCVFPWFLTIEEEPIIWVYNDDSEEEKNVKLSKWYLVFEFCPCSLQTLLDQSEDKKLPLDIAHR